MQGILETLICNRAQSSCLLNRVHFCGSNLLSRGKLIKRETAKMFVVLLLKILKFLYQFQSIDYVFDNWTKPYDADMFDYFHKELNFVFFALKRNMKNCALSLKRRRQAKIIDATAMKLIIISNLKDSEIVQFSTGLEINEEVRDCVTKLKWLQSSIKMKRPKLRTINMTRLAVGKFCKPFDKKNYAGLFEGLQHSNLKGSQQLIDGVLCSLHVTVKYCLSTKLDECLTFFKEAALLQAYQLPGVIKLLGVDKANLSTVLIMEHFVCTLAQLMSLISNRKLKNIFNDRRKLTMLLEYCTIFASLHAIGIVHRDIHPANMLLLPSGHVKVCNFGMSMTSNPFTPNAPIKYESYAYVAPEIKEGSTIYSQATDVFSFGSVVSDVMYFDLGLQHHVDDAYEDDDDDFDIANDMEEIVCCCIEVDPNKRLSFARVCLRLSALL